MYPHIENKTDYDQYVNSVERFFQSEGIANLSIIDGAESFFSWYPCHCCQRELGGDRVWCSGYNPTIKEVFNYRVCIDCYYFAEYGKLDDETMMKIGEDNV